MSDFKDANVRSDRSPEERAGILGKGSVMAATGAAVPKTSPSRSHGGRGKTERPVLTGSQIVCRALEDEGVDTVFGYPGGAVIPLYDALPGAGFHHVLVRFEQWAALAAEGYARATGKPGVCLATSGPGATNLVTGLADAHAGLGADRGHHRAGDPTADRPRCLPGSRHHRHHAAGHEAQLPGEPHSGYGADDSKRRSTWRPAAGPARC